ncbi:hypothetical protein GCM10011357_00430 [Lacimicrobium alkaliphilum]|uniref:DUF3718 domain-containing protein n=2 Tax=Lacimicrobium alkaliphilum TaxID=1526571 RepID=A0ABQ1QVJ0_9ALTE|nr:DUF3718 domain-containing protein [Lacimicrobium alkaliphilum]GGD48444.1 hypothetical protein GCM10011357_00430 [Lacimicrobium alkaliphilum]
MKQSTLLLITAVSAFIFAPASFADINEDLANICTIVKNDDKSELRKKLRDVQNDYRLRLGDYYTGISCGGSSLIRYAMENGSADTGTYMIKRMGKSDLTAAEKDGMELKDWAQSNGYMDSEIGKELLARIN